MDDAKLQKIVEDLSLQYFNKPFKHQAIFNNRLRTTGERYLLGTHNIDINPKYYHEYGMDEIVGIIKHELCHYHLHLEGKGYKHRDRDFRNLLNKVGAPRFCTPLNKETKASRIKLLYKCTECMHVYSRKRRVDTSRYVCGKCGGKINLLEKG